MRFEREEFLLHPVDRVYPLVRDHIQDLLPHLPGISRIEILSRETAGKGKTRVRSRWTIRPPALIGRLLPPAALVWEEDALWTDSKRSVDSKIQGYGYASRTKVSYQAASDYTRVCFEAELTFRPDTVDMPKENLDKILSGGQEALREAIEPNMTAFLEAIRERLGE
jgi:hypothetical protein